MKAILLLLIGFPFLGGAFIAVFGRRLPRRAVELIACGAVLGALGMAITGFIAASQKTYDLTFFRWFSVDAFSAVMNVHYDPLAAIMALMVTFVSSLIHLYSVSFMRKDEDFVRYFCYLNLFVFAMLVITLADNLVFLYLGWEGVGFCSYALIGFWYRDNLKATAGRKAFVLTRIGDVTFGIALALLFVLFRDLSISHIVAHAPSLSTGLATTLGLLLLWAAVGKSAQLPLTVWLPDAMAGPTPVSALIHAATMVTAGVYLLMRLFPILLLSTTTMLVVAIVGAVTAFYAACSALAQVDIKRVLAYSTISQVGFMFLAVGASDIIGSMFLLLSHAFYKALLFLTAGCVIQALADEHDIFRMGNLRKLLPMVYPLFLIGALSLSALPFVGGYFSKDRILLATFIHPGAGYKALWVLAAGAALLTPLYTFRLFFIAFLDRPNGRKRGEVISIPRFMVWVLWPLALLALGDGLLNLPGGPGKLWLAHYLAGLPGALPDLGAPAGLSWGMGIGSASLTAGAVVLAYFLFRPSVPVAPRLEVHEFLFSGFYLDLLYEQIIARPYRRMAKLLWLHIDEGGFDQGFEGVGTGFGLFSGIMRLWTTGKLSTYLKMVFLGFAALLCFLAIGWYVR